MNKATSKKALLKYLASLLIFGSNGVMVCHIDMTSYEIVFLRTLLGSAFLVVLFKILGNSFHIKEHKRDAIFVAIAGILQGVSWVLLYEGYRAIGVGVSSLIYYCGPIILMAFSPLLFKEKLTANRLLGFAIVIVGLLFVNGTALLLGGTSKSTWGYIASILSAVTFFLMLAFNKQSKHIVGMENAVIQLTFSFIALAVFIGFKQQFIMTIPSSSVPWIIVQGILNTGIGCYLYFSPLSELPVQTVAVCGYLEPLSAVVFAAIFLGETMTAIQIIGAICIIGGAMFAEVFGSKQFLLKQRLREKYKDR